MSANMTMMATTTDRTSTGQAAKNARRLARSRQPGPRREVTAARIEHIREAIAAGTYLTDAKLDYVVDALRAVLREE